MTKSYVLDASALIALIFEEKGFEKVESHLQNSCISTVNACEVATYILRNSIQENHDVFLHINNLVPHIEDFDQEQYQQASLIYPHTKHAGLSLGDRACLALAKTKELPVLTADKAWKDLKVGVRIEIIR